MPGGMANPPIGGWVNPEGGASPGGGGRPPIMPGGGGGIAMPPMPGGGGGTRPPIAAGVLAGPALNSVCGRTVFGRSMDCASNRSA